MLQGSMSVDCYNGLEKLVMLIPAQEDTEDLSECSINEYMNYVEVNDIDYDFEEVKLKSIEDKLYSTTYEEPTQEEIESYEDENFHEIMQYLMEVFTNKFDDAETNILEEAFEEFWDNMRSYYDDQITDSIELEVDCEDL